jgi:hypothetical protein
MNPVDMSALQGAREKAETTGDDQKLLSLRELERATSELPPVIDGAHLSDLICGDAISTTWTGWSPATGQRILLRCLHSRWQRDPVMLRQLHRDLHIPTTPSLYPGEHCSSGDWPHNRLVLGGPRLCEILPLDDADGGDPLLLAQVLGGGLCGLAGIHRAGLAHGPNLLQHLFFHNGSVGLAWLGRFGPPANPWADIAALAEASVVLCAQGSLPIRQLALSWQSEPPASAQDAGQLLTRAMASTLLDARHRLWIAHRHQNRRARIGRLASAVRRLQQALPPPQGRVCLRAQGDGQLVIVDGDGLSLRGQATADPLTKELRPVYTADEGLCPGASRFLLRAWASRHRGDEDRRVKIQSSLGARDETATTMMRWLAGMARLRAAGLLLQAEDQLRESAADRVLDAPL